MIQWFRDLRSEQVLTGYNESDWDSLIQKVSESSINGENLRQIKRDDLVLLNVKKLGPQIALLDRIEHLNQSFRSPEGSRTRMSNDHKIFQKLLYLNSNSFLACYLLSLR